MSGKIKIGIVGATGYTGAELVRLLLDHPLAEIRCLTTTSAAGQDLAGIYPFLRPRFSQTLVEYKLDEVKNLDMVFICLPHGKSMEIAPELVNAGVKVIDLGADFRFRDLAAYEQAYQKHAAPEMNAQAVYGLPEYHRARLKKARLVANPGCYVTAATLALKPIVDGLAYLPGSIIIDAKSGVSGAGRALRQDTHFLEVYTNFSAYKIGAHRHQPEIEQNIGDSVVFVPQLLPVNRGILATIYVKLREKLSTEDALAVLRQKYRDEPFVRVVDEPPTLKDALGSNYCLISAKIVGDGGQLVLLSVLDNLVKGASGQAVQNMNIMFDLPETMGLERPALNP
ncbi:N-acetyl-gamma-glutamyl-phosphate reductase [Candidatus Termititenax persephonae]|uniref:N-acetyl-gamma-glutamyl-phosphate reductase n=1 Tax=Candidatus Termititenax persephonae TaxID=2218525 RepID=A0A388TF58_9BACT|nr:N-acetyl-gamma-glutamyl-phosphate reductase [Candidatus Termititenax persephonae]